MKHKFAFFDGDNVGNSIEILLIEGKLLAARNLSENINTAIIEIKDYLTGKGEVLIAGGDDILAKLEDDEKFINTIETVREIFNQRTGLTISCGIGRDLKSAIYNLGIAKLYGKNQTKFQ